MLAIISGIAVIGGFLGLAISVIAGWAPNSTQPVKYWYAAGPDPEPWRTD